MMLNKCQNGDRLLITVKGKLDAISAPKFEEEVASSLDGITELAVSLEEVEYLSSAGLRALLYLHQLMSEHGRLVIRNVPPVVQDIFMLTGFTEIVAIE